MPSEDDWWALDVIEPVYDLPCPRRTCDLNFRSHAVRRAHLRYDHGFSWEFANALVEEQRG